MSAFRRDARKHARNVDGEQESIMKILVMTDHKVKAKAKAKAKGKAKGTGDGRICKSHVEMTTGTWVRQNHHEKCRTEHLEHRGNPKP